MAPATNVRIRTATSCRNHERRATSERQHISSFSEEGMAAGLPTQATSSYYTNILERVLYGFGSRPSAVQPDRGGLVGEDVLQTHKSNRLWNMRAAFVPRGVRRTKAKCPHQWVLTCRGSLPPSLLFGCGVEHIWAGRDWQQKERPALGGPQIELGGVGPSICSASGIIWSSSHEGAFRLARRKTANRAPWIQEQL